MCRVATTVLTVLGFLGACTFLVLVSMFSLFGSCGLVVMLNLIVGGLIGMGWQQKIWRDVFAWSTEEESWSWGEKIFWMAYSLPVLLIDIIFIGLMFMGIWYGATELARQGFNQAIDLNLLVSTVASCLGIVGGMKMVRHLEGMSTVAPIITETMPS